MTVSKCHAPQSGNIVSGDGMSLVSWTDADCGKCPPCIERLREKLFQDLAEINDERDLIKIKLAAL